MSNLDAANQTEANDETLWHVQLPTGEVRKWSLDQLDAAFQAEIIDERTHVLEDGTMDWVKLGDLLGIESSPETVAPAPQVAAPAPVHAPVLAAPVYAASPAAAAAPYYEHTATPEPVSVAMYSVRPVVSDVGDDLDLEQAVLRPRKRGLALGAAAAALVICGAFLAVTKLGAKPAEPATTSTVSAALPVPVPLPVSVQSNLAAGIAVLPAAAPAAADPTPATSNDSRLTPQQRKALADGDKSRDAQRKARASSAPSHGSVSKTVSKPVFHKGGNKFDPLNSSL